MHIIFWLAHSFPLIVLCQAPSSRKRGYVDGDVIIGVLFPIHKTPTADRTSTRECGDIRETYGMHRVEVLLKTINEINRNPDILPGVSLGVDIRDTCMYVPIALEQSIDFIKNSLASQEGAQTTTNTSTKEAQGKAIASLIGSADSTVTMQVQNLLQLFRIPQISYSATAIDLSKKELYKYFLRVVQSDILQAKAVSDLISYYKWEYVSLVFTQGTYGSLGMKELLNNIKNKDICTEQAVELDNNETQLKVTEKVRKLFDNDRAKVIICFCQGETITRMFTAMLNLNKTNKGYLIIGTDGWADRKDVLGHLIDKERNIHQLSHVIHGGISIRLSSLPIPDFDDYFRSKNYSNSPGNPWFQEFWEQHFDCRATDDSIGKYERRCYGNESLYNKAYTQDTKLGFVVKSVMTVAYGLHNLQKKLCLNTGIKCTKFMRLNGTALLEEMLNVSFVAYDNETVKFDSSGDPPGRYEILNYQRTFDNVTGSYHYNYQKVGTWKDDQLEMYDTVQWPSTSEKGDNSIVKSFCSAPCKFGEIREISGNKKCCWQCKTCKQNEYIRLNFSEEMCIGCAEGTKPNKNLSGCHRIIPTYILWSDVTSLIAVLFSCIGIVATFIVTLIFAKHNATPVVKSSTRELMYLILTGIIMCYCTTFPLLSRPSTLSCLFARIMPGLSFSLIFGALVTKTNRICRILATSKKKIVRHKGRFLTTSAQIVITCVLNMIETVIISIMIVLEYPSPEEIFPSWETALLECRNPLKSVFIPFGFDAVLVCLCTWYAFKTRNLPENFNEAKYIGFTMYTTCIIWIGLIPIYFGTDFKIISMCIAINLSATTALVLLFLPKVYIILYRPEKNERSAFITTTDIRCYIGPTKIDNQASKDKRQKAELEHRIFRDLSHSSLFATNLNEYSCNNCSAKISDVIHSVSSTYNRAVQTESILILSQVPPGNALVDDISLTQMALLQFLDENWTSNCVPVTDIRTRSRSTLRCTDLDRIRSIDAEDYSEEEDEDDNEPDESSMAGHPIMRPVTTTSHRSPVPVTASTTYSPLSNVSTDASSTISNLFLEYLKTHGRRFSKTENNKSIKL